MEDLETSVRTLMRAKEELHQLLEEQNVSVTAQKETHKLRIQNQELQHKVPDTKSDPESVSPHLPGLKVKLLSFSCQSCRTRICRSTN